jgi:hypothetical protein
MTTYRQIASSDIATAGGELTANAMPIAGGVLTSGNLSAGSVTPTGGNTASTLTSLLATAMTPQSFSSLVSGGNWTPALQALLNCGGLVVIPPGTYLTDDLTVSVPVSLFLLPGAILKQRTGAASSRWTLNFATGSAGSVVWGGGTFDGNRASLLSAWPGLNWLNNIFWGAINNQAGINNITIRDITIQNYATSSLFFANTTAPCLWDNILIYSCGAGALAISCDRLTVRDLNCDSCGNGSINIYPETHLFENCTRSSFDNLTVTNWLPSASGADPYGCGVTWQACTDVQCSNVRIASFSGSDSSGGNHSIGVLVKGAYNSQFSNIQTSGSVVGQNYQGLFGCNLTGLSNDGQYIVSVGSYATNNTGIWIQAGGEYITSGSSAQDFVDCSTGRHNTISGVMTTGCDVGMLISSEGISISNVIANGNTQYGVSVSNDLALGWFPAQPVQLARAVTLTGVTARYNGHAGLIVGGADEITIGSGCDFTDNGQSSTLGAEYRSGIIMVGNSYYTNFLGLVRVAADVKLGDTQSWTSSLAVSFKPGTVNGAGNYSVTLIDPQRVDIGQQICLKNASGSADIYATVIDLDGQSATVNPLYGMTTFGSVGNTAALPGTVSSSGQNVTGVGTNFSAITGPVWVSGDGGSTWSQVVRVTSGTSMVVSPAPSPAWTSATLIQLRVNMWGVNTENYGIYIDPTVTGPVILDVWPEATGGPLWVSSLYVGNLTSVSIGNPAGSALTAYAGGGQANGTLLTCEVNRLAVVATVNDSVRLPRAIAGMKCYLFNDTLNAAAVFSSGGTDYLNGSLTLPFSLPAKTMALFISPVIGMWLTSSVV